MSKTDCRPAGTPKKHARLWVGYVGCIKGSKYNTEQQKALLDELKVIICKDADLQKVSAANPPPPRLMDAEFAAWSALIALTDRCSKSINRKAVKAVDALLKSRGLGNYTVKLGKGLQAKGCRSAAPPVNWINHQTFKLMEADGSGERGRATRQAEVDFRGKKLKASVKLTLTAEWPCVPHGDNVTSQEQELS